MQLEGYTQIVNMQFISVTLKLRNQKVVKCYYKFWNICWLVRTPVYPDLVFYLHQTEKIRHNDPMILVLFCVVLFLLSESGLLGTLHHSDGGEIFGEGREGFGYNMV